MKYALHFVAMMWRQQRRWMLAGAIASFFALLSAIALLALSGWFITAAGLAGLAGAGATFDFFRPSAGIRFLALFRTASRYGERLATHDATLRFFASLRATLFTSVARATSYSRKLRSSELLQRLTADLDAIDTLYLRLLLPAAIAIALALGGAVLLVFLSPPLAATILAAFAASAAAIYVGAQFARKAAQRMALGSEALRVRSIDLVRAQTDLLLSGGIASQKQRVARAANYLADAGKRIGRIETATGAAIALAAVCLTAGVLLLGGAAFEAGAVEGPTMAMLVIGGFAALEVFGPLRRGGIELGRIAFSGRRLLQLARVEPERDERVFTRRGLAIAAIDVTYRYDPQARTLFDRFNFAARHGERIALAGRSGCGKSTLLSLIAGLRQPESGSILIGSSEDTHPVLGYLTQETELFAGSISENLRIAAPLAADEALWRALEIAELRGKIEALEGGLAWQLGETGSGFSGGERRRLAIARLILRNPQIWLLDEPTAGMDEALARAVLDNLFAHAPEATFLIAAHHEREIERANRVIHLSAAHT